MEWIKVFPSSTAPSPRAGHGSSLLLASSWSPFPEIVISGGIGASGEIFNDLHAFNTSIVHYFPY